jgi:succinate-acetate transporter protein
MPARSGAEHSENGDGAVEATRILLRPLANPLSLGFVGLLFATILLSALELKWVPANQAHLLAIGMLVFTVPLQAVSCAYGFFVRDPVCATGMGAQAGMWATIGLSHLVSPPGRTTSALGLMLVMGAVAVIVPASGAAKSKMLAATLFYTTAVRWALTAVFEFTADQTCRTAAGAVGVLLAALALYSALAFELEDQQRRTVLPTFRRGAGRLAMTGPLRDQVERVANEAGVRKQL